MHGSKPPEIRYALRIEDNGTWTVFDTFSNKPARFGPSDHRDADERYRGDHGGPKPPPSRERQRDDSLAKALSHQSLSIYCESLISAEENAERTLSATAFWMSAPQVREFHEQTAPTGSRNPAEKYAPTPQGSSLLYGLIAVVLLGASLWIIGRFYGFSFLDHPTFPVTGSIAAFCGIVTTLPM